MLSVIVDTSSLIAFAMAARMKYPPGELSGFHRLERGFSNTLHALVLYSERSVDGPSVSRNITSYPELELVTRHFTSIPLTEHEESRLYSSFEEIEEHITGYLGILSSGHTEEWMAAECDVRRIYPSARWRDVFGRLPENMREVALSLDMRLHPGEYLSAACLSILRTVYYQALQRSVGGDLLLDPWKGAFYTQEQFLGASILEIFDDTVRKAFEERKERWFGRRDMSLKFPLLTQYIMNKSRSWEETVDVALELADSRAARLFRDGLRELACAIEEGDNESIDATISLLDQAQSSWSLKLGAKLAPPRKLTLTVPFLNLGTEFYVPDKRIRRRTGSKILVLVQELLSSA